MKKYFPANKAIALTLLLLVSIGFSSYATYYEGYYNAMEGKKKAELKAAVKSIISNHRALGYYDLPTYWERSDVYPEKVNGCLRWWEMYSDEVYLIQNGQTAKASFSANKMQREHSIPKSWWKKNGDVEYTPAYTDMWNLYPSDGPANQAKLNYPLGECSSTTFDNGITKVGPAKPGLGGGCGYVFEPADEYKGDFARTCFYMATVYNDLPWVYTYMFKTEDWPTLQPWAVDMLLQWSRQDPVSEKEIIRNDAVEDCQNNRNPFVDFPELAEYIWGLRTEEVFYIKDQEGGNVTPPITGDPELSLPLDGSSLQFNPVAEGVSTTSWLRFVGKNLTSSLSLTIVGDDRSSFRLSNNSIQPGWINGKEYYDMPIVFTPTHTGEHTARLVVYDGGLEADKNVIVTLQGVGAERPALSKLTAIEPTIINAYQYTANWLASPEPVEYYIVTRTRYLDGDIDSEDYQTDTNSITFTDRDPDVDESYFVRSYMLGVTSEPSNSVTVAGSGVESLQGEISNLLLMIEGGVIASPYALPQSVIVYTPAGNVQGIYELSAGETLMLPAGVWILKSNLSRKPLKMIVVD